MRLWGSPVSEEQELADVLRLEQEEAPDILHLVATFLLFDGRQNEETFDVMNKHGAFPKLLELISERRKNGDEAGLHRLLMELLYEMSRIQRITPEELSE
jgi:hypothetical protein